MTIEATAVVSFNSSEAESEDYIFNIELDDTLNLDSKGKPQTSFAPGDQVYLFVNKSFNVDVTAVVVTAGSVRSLGDGERTGESTNLFASREAPKEGGEDPGKYTLDKITTLCTVSYIGNTGRLTEEATKIDGRSFISNIGYTPFIAKFNYTYPGRGYLVTPPIMVLEENETFPLAVVFYITVNEV